MTYFIIQSTLSTTFYFLYLHIFLIRRVLKHYKQKLKIPYIMGTEGISIYQSARLFLVKGQAICLS